MWTFLDKMNYNILYEYADVIAGTKSNLDLHSTDEDERQKKAYYIINFVYKYVLNCETLEEALSCTSDDLLKKYHLKHFLDHYYLYVGIGEYKRPFYRTSDMAMILEILYNRYDFWEQLDCFCRNTKNLRKRRCLEAIELYKVMYRRIENDRQKGDF